MNEVDRIEQHNRVSKSRWRAIRLRLASLDAAVSLAHRDTDGALGEKKDSDEILQDAKKFEQFLIGD